MVRGERGAGGEVQLTDAMAKLIGNQPFHGLRYEGQRFDCGDKAGFLEAQIAFSTPYVRMPSAFLVRKDSDLAAATPDALASRRIGVEKGDVAFCEFINETLQDNEDAYLEAWEATAGQVEGTEEPELPEPDECA